LVSGVAVVRVIVAGTGIGGLSAALSLHAGTAFVSFAESPAGVVVRVRDRTGCCRR
jgi:aspartate oxidase